MVGVALIIVYRTDSTLSMIAVTVIIVDRIDYTLIRKQAPCSYCSYKGENIDKTWS